MGLIMTHMIKNILHKTEIYKGTLYPKRGKAKTAYIFAFPSREMRYILKRVELSCLNTFVFYLYTVELGIEKPNKNIYTALCVKDECNEDSFIEDSKGGRVYVGERLA